ncbi:hypothetical protein Dsin_004987 [Dipteronia sinensis]|uniref:Uncharacterized protein n=1 Tax=Dipteronia sinensis TaxID=43782 RepID=A0AAE0AWI9_9ROSI|nr:hypothetical protein Dsin_004987 [Dipteronia sinensis]
MLTSRKSAELRSVQSQMSDLGFSEELFLTESRIHHDLDVLLHRHECFFRDRSRVKWLQDGDRNSSFFHSSIKCRQCRSVLSSLSIDGVISVDQTVIRDHIVMFYVDLFSSDSDLIDRDLSIVDDIVPYLVS